MCGLVDIAWLISEHIELDPEVCTRLASVNKSFHHVFTSDRIWKHFNPYGLESGIYHHYMQSTKRDRAIAQTYWRCNQISGEMFGRLSRETNNLYALAALYRAVKYPPYLVDQRLKKNKTFMLLVASQSLYYAAGDNLIGDPDFFIACKLPKLIYEQGDPEPTSTSELHFKGVKKQGIIKIIEQCLDSYEITRYLETISLHQGLDPDIVKAAKHKAIHLALYMSDEDLEKLFEDFPQLLAPCIQHYRTKIIGAVQNLVTKSTILKIKGNLWCQMLYYLDPEWMHDTEFMKGIIENAKTNLVLPPFANLNIVWIETMSGVFSSEQFELYKKSQARRVGRMPRELTCKEVKSLKGRGYVNYLVLEYFSLSLEPSGRRNLLAHFQETEFIERALSMKIIITPDQVSEELLSSREWALRLVKHNYLFYSHLSEELKNDPEFFDAIFVRELGPKDFALTGGPSQRWLDMSSLPVRWASHRKSIKRILKSDRLLELPFREQTVQIIAGDNELIEDLTNSFVKNRDDLVKTFVPLCSVEGAKPLMRFLPTILPIPWVIRFLKTVSRPLLCEIASHSGIVDGELLADFEVLSNSIRNHPFTMEFAPESVRSDPKQVAALARINPAVISKVEPEVQVAVLEMMS